MTEKTAEARTAARYPAVNPEVYFGWWESSGFQTRAAAIRDVSQGGALVSVALPSPEASALWLCAGGSPPSDWVSVSIVDETTPREGLFQVRLQFVDGCPYDLYKKAVYGIGLGEASD